MRPQNTLVMAWQSQAEALAPVLLNIISLKSWSTLWISNYLGKEKEKTGCWKQLSKSSSTASILGIKGFWTNFMPAQMRYENASLIPIVQWLSLNRLGLSLKCYWQFWIRMWVLLQFRKPISFTWSCLTYPGARLSSLSSSVSYRKDNRKRFRKSLWI